MDRRTTLADEDRKEDARGALVWAAFLGAIAGLIVGGIAMAAAWQHNTQGEIRVDGNIDWGYWILIGISWALPTALIVGPLMFVFWKAVTAANRSSSLR